MEWEDVKHNKDIALLLKKIRGKGGGSMIKETIQAVEDAEAKASELVAQALEDARRVKAEAEAEADRMLADAQKREKEAAVKQEEELTLRGEEYVKSGTGRSRGGVPDAQRDGGQTETGGG